MQLEKNYVSTGSTLEESLHRLRNYIDEVPQKLSMMEERELTHKPDGKWSRKEMLGHLIDSAVNNLKRFTDIQFTELPYVVQPYRQDDLVRINRYQYLPLDHLLLTWQSLNRQIVYVVENLSPEVQQYPIILPGRGTTSTLVWLIQDYVAHMEHHLNTLIQPTSSL